MAIDSSGAGGPAIERWDQLHQTLGAQERRMIIYSLMDVPEERRVPLPDSIQSELSLEPERLRTSLVHHHLPQMANHDYIRWEQEPLCVQRGPRFEEVESLFRLIRASIDSFPKTLIDGCVIYEELRYNDNR